MGRIAEVEDLTLKEIAKNINDLKEDSNTMNQMIKDIYEMGYNLNNPKEQEYFLTALYRKTLQRAIVVVMSNTEHNINPELHDLTISEVQEELLKSYSSYKVQKIMDESRKYGSWSDINKMIEISYNKNKDDGRPYSIIDYNN